MRHPLPVFSGVLLVLAHAAPAQVNHAAGKPVTASSLHDPVLYPAANAVDGDLSDASRWLGAASPTGNWLEIDLGAATTLRQAHLYFGYQEQASSAVDSYGFERWDGGAWQAIPGTTVSGTGYLATTFNFAAAVTSDRLRFVVNDTDICRLRDLTLWENPTDLYTGTTGQNRPSWIEQGFINYAHGKPVTASSTIGADEPRFAVDGVVSDASRWVSAAGAGEFLEIDLGAGVILEEAHLYNGLLPGQTGGGNFSDNFEDGEASDWTFLDRDGAVDTNWVVTDESGSGGSSVLQQTTPDYTFPRDGDNDPVLGTIALAPAGSFAASATALDFRYDGTSGTEDVNIIFGYRDADNFYAFDFAANGAFALREIAEGNRITRVSVPSASLTPGIFHRVSLSHDPATGNVVVTLNGSVILDTLDANFLEGGQIGVGSNNDHFTIDNVVSGDVGTMTAGRTHLHLEFWNGSTWQAIPGAAVVDSPITAHRLTFASPVTTDRLRVVNDNTDPEDSGRLQLREIALWHQSLPLGTGMTGPGINPTNIPIIALNQIGYATDAPKRFTAPIATDGTPFEITAKADPGTVLFSGTITGGRGDFSAFVPASSGPYVLRYTPDGESPVSSYPFLIAPDLLEQKLVIPCIQFMADSRSGAGTHPSAYGGNPWRDGTYYSFEIPSLVYLHLNARGTSSSLTGEIDYDAEKVMILDPAFDSTYVPAAQSSGFLPALRSYYTTYDPPLPGCPDALKAVHFGLGVTMERPNTKDPSGPISEHLHAQTREWFAWFLYAWPVLREHLPDSFYAACRDFTFANWATSSFGDGSVAQNHPSPLDIDPLWAPSTYGTIDKHPYKGRHAPGHSILPNLLLWQVALREGRSDADTYLNAATAQTEWIIANLDWSDPAVTKGHRMSEHKMMPGLVHFLRRHPAQAPPGLAAKIEAWADTMIARSDNMWDFRRYELSDTDNDGVVDWTIPKRSVNWNEPGNLGGFPACALSAAWTLDHAPAKQQRLRELSQAALDCLFGRNPLNTGSASRPQLGFPDQETAWTPAYSGSAAYLETVRGALASGPGSEHFPYDPTGPKRWYEGWVNFNAALNLGITYLLADRSSNPQPLAAAFPLVVSEVHSQSANPLAEFVELHNPTEEAVRLAGLTLAGDVTFSAPAATPNLAAGARCLVVRDVAAFESVYGPGRPVIGAYSGALDDAGGLLEVGDVNGNTFRSLDVSGLPLFPGHSSTYGSAGWRLSADAGGSPGTSDAMTFTGDPTDDTNDDGVPDLLNHAVSGLDRPYVAPTFDLNGPDVLVRVTRNLAADDSMLDLAYSTNLVTWIDAGPPASEVPGGDRTATRTYIFHGPPPRLFVRLGATLVGP